jgi:hypothetical protein
MSPQVGELVFVSLAMCCRIVATMSCCALPLFLLLLVVALLGTAEVGADGEETAVSTTVDTAAIMVPKATGQELKRRVQEAFGSGSALFIGAPQPDATIRRYWDELETLLDHKVSGARLLLLLGLRGDGNGKWWQNWPVDSKDRRKDYFKKSMHHHPDKPGGNKARFEVLNYAYRRANHRCGGLLATLSPLLAVTLQCPDVLADMTRKTLNLSTIWSEVVYVRHLLLAPC